MSTCAGNYSLIGLSSLPLTKADQKQGIVSILASDGAETTAKAASIRRNLSADMSSKTWLAQNGFSPAKKPPSPQDLFSSSSSFSSDGEEEYEEKKEDAESPMQVDVWSSILSQKAKMDSLPPPYVHPLEKRSSSMSEKSLEICTENLGSETGSDEFFDSIEARNDKLQQEDQQSQKSQFFDSNEARVVKYKKSPPQIQSFPPPLPSLSCEDRQSLRPHRENGRLVLEAVPVPPQSYLHAERQDGRLLLTFFSPSPCKHHETGSAKETEDEEEEEEEVEEEEGEEEEEQEQEIAGKDKEVNGEMEIGIVTEKTPKLVSTNVIDVQRPAIMMKKLLMELANSNRTWPPKYNQVVHFEPEEEEPLPPPRVARLIPSSAAAVAAAAASFNAYEYYWRQSKPPKPAAAAKSALTRHQPPKSIKNNANEFIITKNSSRSRGEKQELLLFRGNRADYFLPVLGGCKEPRAKNSVLILEPRYISASQAILTSQC